MFKLGFFINITQKDNIIVKKWDNKFEDFISVQGDDYELYRNSALAMELDKYLGAYPLDRF